MPNNDKNPLRVLILEDRAEDAELLLHELRKAGFTVDARRVEDEASFQAHLHADVDIILADYALPGYNALNALASLQKSGLDIPFIIVTGALSDEDAADCIKRGADDYLRKDRVARLGHAVAVALDQRRLRAEGIAAEQALRASEQKYRLLFNKIRDPVFVVEVSAEGRFGGIIEANDAACLRLGYAREALLKLAVQDIDAPDRARILKLVAEKIMTDGSLSFDTEMVAKNGAKIPVDMFLNRFDLNGKTAVLAIARDVSELRKMEQQKYRIYEMEKKMLGMELHDSVGQYITVIAFKSKILENRLKALKLREADEAEELTRLISQTSVIVRNTAKTLFPVELEKRGMEAALRTLLVFMETQFEAKCKLDYQLPDDAVNILAATNLYRIVQETMNNAAKHSHARNFNIRLVCDQDRIVLTVWDDGRPPSSEPVHPEGLGRDIMAYRAKLLKASMTCQAAKAGGNEMVLSFSQHSVLTD